MKKVFIFLISIFTLVSCTKSGSDVPTEIFDYKAHTPDVVACYYLESYSAVDMEQPEPTYETAYQSIVATELFPEDVIVRVLNTPISERSKMELMLPYVEARRNNVETDLETIARKQIGSLNVNGGRAYWDCSSILLATTISQLGNTCDIGAVNNYYNFGTSATKITMSDVVRAANGFINTSFNSTIELIDLVFEVDVSGDGNWLVGAIILDSQGEEHLYSNFVGDNGPLVYDPQDGGIYLVGPMPEGVVSLNVTGLFDPPPSTL